MEPDKRPVPAEQEALDKPWRIWASVAIIGFVIISLVLGFVIVPGRLDPGGDVSSTIGRALGRHTMEHKEPPAVSRAVPAGEVSDVTWTPQLRHLLAGADTARGEATASEICVACHGTDGIALVPGYPNLTHQSARAIFKQLRDYRSGARQSGMAAVMRPMAAQLNDRQMADVAAYYASLPERDANYGAETPAQIVRLVKIGDQARAMPPCDSCHGVNMTGPEESPVLLGQSPEYFEQQLRGFASGERRNDIYGRMRMIARALTPQEISGLAEYYAPPSSVHNF